MRVIWNSCRRTTQGLAVSCNSRAVLCSTVARHVHRPARNCISMLASLDVVRCAMEFATQTPSNALHGCLAGRVDPRCQEFCCTNFIFFLASERNGCVYLSRGQKVPARFVKRQRILEPTLMERESCFGCGIQAACNQRGSVKHLRGHPPALGRFWNARPHGHGGDFFL